MTSIHNLKAVIMSTCSSSLSIVASFIIFGSYIFIPEIRNSTRKLVTCLTVADFLTALGYLISALAHFQGTEGDVCLTQSVITTYSSLVSFYLTVAIAVHIFITVVYRKNTTSSWTFFLCTIATCWFIPGIIVGVAYVQDVIAEDYDKGSDNASAATGPWCWLKHNHKSYILWIFLSGKGWEFLCYLITTSVYVLLKWNRKLNHNRERFQVIQDNLRNEDQNYLYVWLILYILRLWGSVRSMMVLAGADKKYVGFEISKILMYMQAIGDPGQAFCNFLLFCVLDKTVRNHVLNTCCNCYSARNSLEERTPLLRDESGHSNSNTQSTIFPSSNSVHTECLLEKSEKHEIHSSFSSTDKTTSVQSRISRETNNVTSV